MHVCLCPCGLLASAAPVQAQQSGLPWSGRAEPPLLGFCGGGEGSLWAATLGAGEGRTGWRLWAGLACQDGTKGNQIIVLRSISHFYRMAWQGDLENGNEL